MALVLHLCIILSTVLVSSVTKAQVPTVCVQNVTSSKVCCPTPAGFKEPCGGKDRGYCRKYQVYHEYPYLERQFVIDDRLNWPKRFFEYGCHCEPNFYGVDCGECWFGMDGPQCKEKVYYTRRNIFSFSALEKKRYQTLIAESRNVDSGYMVLLEDSLETSDPLTKNPTFLPASLHYYLVTLHRYASRATLFKEPDICKKYGFLDNNHGGPGFMTWHRMFMLLWERALRKMAIKMYGWKDFAIPYWDWIDAQWCEVCTNDLMGSLGEMTPAGPRGHLQRVHQASPFYEWDEYCTEPLKNTGTNRCYACHFSKGVKLNRQFKALTYPTSADVDFLMDRKVYYVSTNGPDKNSSPNCEGFTEAIEGFCGRRESNDGLLWMHNKVHNLVRGSFCCSSTAANDPKFTLHHSQIDRLVQKWFTLRRPHNTQMPTQFSRPGHYKDSNMVGYLPPLPHRAMFVDMSDLGIVYDNLDFGNQTRSNIRPPITPEWAMYLKLQAEKEAQFKRDLKEMDMKLPGFRRKPI